ncbi:S-adenosyl-L-methionine-dependent methyltransferase [Mycena sp. CBHHK59/15]|nr:S-adenosyl-L-methionine-dependent methyltransferase [Mycena sp. CBHHK59/15]
MSRSSISTFSTSGLAEMRALVQLISNAVSQMAADPAAQAIPSLYSTSKGPFDTPEDTPANITKAVKTIEAACAQLCFTITSPGHVFVNYGSNAAQVQEPTCLLVAAEAKIADHLLDQPHGLHVDELARRSGIDSDKLVRILRLLATKHCFIEVKANVFANNRISLKLLSTDPISSFLGHVTDEGMKAICMLNDTLRDPTKTSSALPNDSAFKNAHGHILFNYYTLRFNRAMIGWGSVTGKSILPKVYPWGALPPGTTICDVGGGNGHATVNLLKAFPALKFVVQDLPEVIDQGKSFIQTEITDSALRSRVEYASLDFFNETPVKDCDIYFVRPSSHDWPTPACQQILESVRKAMKPSSRLLIQDYVLQILAREGNSGRFAGQAPEPLLPNYGVGNVRAYAQDITMVAFLNSKERTLREFVDLGARRGFQFIKLWDQGEMGLLEFELAVTTDSME